jgi:hypothetical protein
MIVEEHDRGGIVRKSGLDDLARAAPSIWGALLPIGS